MAVETLPFYADPYKETVLGLGGPKGLVLVSVTAEVEIELENEFDNQRRKGHNAARPKFLGIKPAEISVDFVVYPDEEEQFFRDVVPVLRAKAKNGNSPPLEILNQQANRLGINMVILKRSKIGKPDAKEGRHVSIQLQEWTPGTVDPAKTKAKNQNTLPPGIEPVNVFTNQ